MQLLNYLILLKVLCVSHVIQLTFLVKASNSVKDFLQEPQEEFCTATPAANLPTTAQCRPASDNSIEYQVEVVPVSGQGLSSQCDVQVTLVGSLGTQDMSKFGFLAQTFCLKEQLHLKFSSSSAYIGIACLYYRRVATNINFIRR